MAKTAYQKQADKRTKDALRLRARFDARLRKAAQQLMAAVAGTLDARTRINRINALYGVDISTETLLAHDVRVADFSGQLGTLLGQSAPGEEVQLLNPTANGNGGDLLPNEAVFGETVTFGGVQSMPVGGGRTSDIGGSAIPLDSGFKPGPPPSGNPFEGGMTFP